MVPADTCHAAIRHQLHTRLAGRVEQTVNDGLRRIRRGKHPAVTFGLELNPVGGEPRHRIARLKLLERRNQRPLAAGKAGGEFAFVKTGVRDVATAAAGDFDLGKKLRSFFEDDNFSAALRFRARQRGKKSGRAATHDADAP